MQASRKAIMVQAGRSKGQGSRSPKYGHLAIAAGFLALSHPLQAAEPTAVPPPAQTEAKPFLKPSLIPDITTPVNLQILKVGVVPPPGVITSQSISPTQLTIPSLWWTAEQIASQEKYGNRFLQGWIAYLTQDGRPGQIDLVVNQQLWSQMDYVARYELINRFSPIARNYGFNIRLFRSQGDIAAAYTCDFSGINASALQIPATQSSSPYIRNAIADQIICKTIIQDAVRASDRELLPQP
jgi:hypothetical protein